MGGSKLPTLGGDMSRAHRPLWKNVSLTLQALRRLKTLIIVWLGLSASVFAQAQFMSEIRRAQKHCRSLECPNSPIKKVIMSDSDWRTLPLSVRQHLRQVARNLVNERWPDAILEGDYVIKGPSRLDQKAWLLRGREPVGYWIQYSVRAWNYSNCDFDPFQNPSLKGCLEGRIYEAAFVSLDLKEYDVDENQLAEFYPKR